MLFSQLIDNRWDDLITEAFSAWGVEASDQRRAVMLQIVADHEDDNQRLDALEDYLCSLPKKEAA